MDDSFELDVRADSENETVWLTQEEMSLLFDVDRSRIVRHIRNIYLDGELDKESTCAESAHIPSKRSREYITVLYNLDVVISVGYRVKSQRGIIFRRWANQVLKQYLIQGVAINQKRIEKLNKVVDIQNRMLAYTLNIDREELRKVIDSYTRALDILDSYDHQTLAKPKGSKCDYVMTYEEVREIIDSMSFSNSSAVFGVEKEQGKVNLLSN